MSRLRAVVTIHPAGLGGTPDAGHRATASANASCTASSTIPMSFHRRTRMATTRPYSSRNTRSVATRSGLDTSSDVALERSDFDRQAGVLTWQGQNLRQLARPVDGNVQLTCL